MHGRSTGRPLRYFSGGLAAPMRERGACSDRKRRVGSELVRPVVPSIGAGRRTISSLRQSVGVGLCKFKPSLRGKKGRARSF